MTQLRNFLTRWEFFLLLILAATFLVGSQVSPYFLTTSNLSIALAGAMPVALVALPMTLIIVTGEIDISVGSIVGLCAASIAVAIERGVPIGGAMLIGVIIGSLAGAINGVFVVCVGLPSLVVTIGTLALYRGIAQIILEERGISSFPDWYQSIGFGVIGSSFIPWSAAVFLVFFAGFWVFLHATYWGRALFAIGNNREASRFSGIDVRRAILGCFIAAGTMCSLAAIVLTAYLASARSDTATGLELFVITAVVLGGVDIFGGSGSMLGVFIAVLVLAFVQNSLGLAGVTPEEQQIVTGGVLVATLAVFGWAALIRNTKTKLARRAGI